MDETFYWEMIMKKMMIFSLLLGCSDWNVRQVPSGAILNTKTGCYNLKPTITSHPVDKSICQFGFVYDLNYGSGDPVKDYCGDPTKIPWPEWCP